MEQQPRPLLDVLAETGLHAGYPRQLAQLTDQLEAAGLTSGVAEDLVWYGWSFVSQPTRWFYSLLIGNGDWTHAAHVARSARRLRNSQAARDHQRLLDVREREIAYREAQLRAAENESVPDYLRVADTNDIRLNGIDPNTRAGVIEAFDRCWWRIDQIEHWCHPPGDSVREILAAERGWQSPTERKGEGDLRMWQRELRDRKAKLGQEGGK